MANRTEVLNAINDAINEINSAVKRKQGAAVRASSAAAVTGSSSASAPAAVTGGGDEFLDIEPGSKTETTLKLLTLAARSPRRLGPVISNWVNSPQSPIDELEYLAFGASLNITIDEDIANAFGYTAGGGGSTSGGGRDNDRPLLNFLRDLLVRGIKAGGGLSPIFGGSFGVRPLFPIP